MLGILRTPRRAAERLGVSFATVLVAVTFIASARAQDRPHQLDDATLIGRVESALLGMAPTNVLAEKCMLPHLIEMEARGFSLEALPVATASELQFYETPDGNFRIEYSTSGLDSVDVTDADASGVPDYVEWVAEAMQESWAYEIGVLGFPAIPLGAEERYRVQLKRASGFYGWTNYRNVTDPGGSNIVVNSDFAAFYRSFPSLLNDDPDGLVRGAIRVTCAHEFKHALQISEGWNVSEAPLWVEVDATAMEDLVYDQVNDYYNYIRQTGSPFTSPQTSLLEATYNDATWHLFLAEQYTTDFLVDFSAYRGIQPLTIAPTAYFETAQQREIEWQSLWREYALWNFLTGDRTTPTRGFEEAEFYPTAPTQAISQVPFGPTQFSLSPWANRFHVVDNAQRDHRGGVRIHFESGHQNWGVTLVLQNADSTFVLPLIVTAEDDSLETAGVDVVNFDRIAVIVGNARVALHAFQQDLYSLSIEFDPTSSFGSFKRLFGGSSDQ